MSFLLDTNICSAHFRRPAGLSHRMLQHSGRLFVPTIVAAELYAGAYQLPAPASLVEKITALLEDLQVLVFDTACAEQFGKVRGTLQRQGISVSSLDLMIASVALVHDLTLVTHNIKDFERVPGLRLADWLAP